MGIDGCSVPTWSLPLAALARGFARFGTGEGLAPAPRAQRRSGWCRPASPRRYWWRGTGGSTPSPCARSRPRAVRQRRRRSACIARRCRGLGSASRSRSTTAPSAGPSARSPNCSRRCCPRRGRRWPISSTARCSIGAASASDGSMASADLQQRRRGAPPGWPPGRRGRGLAGDVGIDREIAIGLGTRLESRSGPVGVCPLMARMRAVLGAGDQIVGDQRGARRRDRPIRRCRYARCGSDCR